MKFIAILSIIALFLSGLSLGSVYASIENVFDKANTSVSFISDIISLPNAQRYDFEYIIGNKNITNPILNPNDTMSLDAFLNMQQKVFANANLPSDMQSHINSFYGNPDNYKLVDKYIYLLKGACYLTLETDAQGFKENSRVLINYTIPCVRIQYNGDIYYMLDPLKTLFLQVTSVPSPFVTYALWNGSLNDDNIEISRRFVGANVLKEVGYATYIGVPSVGAKLASNINNISYNEYDYPEYKLNLVQSSYETLNYLNGDYGLIEITKINVLGYTSGNEIKPYPSI